jgi:hypothetical protein
MPPVDSGSVGCNNTSAYHGNDAGFCFSGAEVQHTRPTDNRIVVRRIPVPWVKPRIAVVGVLEAQGTGILRFPQESVSV